MGTSYASDNFIGSRETGCPRLRTIGWTNITISNSVRRREDIVKSRDSTCHVCQPRWKDGDPLRSHQLRWSDGNHRWALLRRWRCCHVVVRGWYIHDTGSSLGVTVTSPCHLANGLGGTWFMRHSKLALESLMTTTSYGRIKLGSLNPSSALAGSPCQSRRISAVLETYLFFGISHPLIFWKSRVRSFLYRQI